MNAKNMRLGVLCMFPAALLLDLSVFVYMFGGLPYPVYNRPFPLIVLALGGSVVLLNIGVFYYWLNEGDAVDHRLPDLE